MKIVVFDLDETLGYFTELGIFYDCLKKYLNTENNTTALTQTDFNDILDLFPEFLRPNIINILTYLKKKKESNCCHKMMIYTNNNGPPEWANHIISYFESKIKHKLIDQLIAAFKINGKQVEICRTTHSKTHKDLIRCTKIPPNAEICFLDDTFYSEMANENIYYINIKPYYYDLPFDIMLNRFKNSNCGKRIIKDDTNFIRECYRILKPGGIMVVSVPDPAMIGKAIGTIEPDFALPSPLKKSCPKTISKPKIKITIEPAMANELISSPNNSKNC
jgi:SAM-dependent methyltransferase